MSILRLLTAFIGARAWKRFEAATHCPVESQEKFLARLIAANRETDFGKKHGFSSIRTISDYQKNVPVRGYAGLSDWVDRIANGEQSILTREPVVYFNQSSGTSGKPKLIPVTRSWLQETAKLRLIWGHLASQARPGILGGKTISIVYAAYGGKTPGGIEYGSLSGRVALQSPLALRRRYALPYDIARIADPESKQYASMRLAMIQDVTFLFSTNAATILAMLETGERRKEELIRDIRDGTLSLNLDLPEGVRESLAPLLTANPEAAKRLESFVEARGGQLRPMDFWPNAALIGCWLASTVGVATKRLPEWFGPSLAVRDVGLAASEGVFTLPVEDSIPFGPLTVSSNFIEFIPIDDLGLEDPRALAVGELENGAEYGMVLTTSAGLYRYNINDVVRVAGRFNETPMLEFVRKGSDSANLVGEKMDISHILTAVERAQKETGVHIVEFKAQADAQAFCYRFYVELPPDAPAGTEQKLAPALHAALMQLNPYYAKWIGEKQLHALDICRMKQGWFERYVTRSLQKGGRHGQFKPALLTLNPEPDEEKA